MASRILMASHDMATATALRRSCQIGWAGVSGFTFMKATASGWADYVKDPYTTIPETHERIAATSMEATWRWQRSPADFEAGDARVLDTMLQVFATTYSHSVQDSRNRMSLAALEIVPELVTISLACPNKHYLPINLSPFGLDNPNSVFVVTDEPTGRLNVRSGGVGD